MQCYEKNDYWGACRYNCTPGIYPEDARQFRTPWTCKEIRNASDDALQRDSDEPAAPQMNTPRPITPKPRSPAQECSRLGSNCKELECCGSLQCYEKNATWAACRSSCAPGIDTREPAEHQSPWTCKVRGAGQPKHTLIMAPGLLGAPVVQPTDAPGLDLRPHTTSPTTTPAPVLTAAPLVVATTPTARRAPDQDRSPPEPSSPLVCDASWTEGALPIDGSGDPHTFARGDGGRVSGNSLILNHDSGYSILSACSGPWSPYQLHAFKLLGRTIEFFVDLSKVGCACNLAFYLVSAPAKDIGGKPSAGQCDDNPFYCDANTVCGQSCPEIDIMEANNHVFQATPHHCDPPSKGHYSSCDGSGCAQSTKDIPSSFGPGAAFTIDTTRPFIVSTAFPAQGTTLTGMVTTLRQDARKVVLDHGACNNGYIQQLSTAMQEGMSLRITYWGDSASTMGWMDQTVCGAETCSGGNAGPGTISNIAITPPEEPVPVTTQPPTTAPPPTNFPLFPPPVVPAASPTFPPPVVVPAASPTFPPPVVPTAPPTFPPPVTLQPSVASQPGATPTPAPTRVPVAPPAPAPVAPGPNVNEPTRQPKWLPCSKAWGQCGGQTFTGHRCCREGSHCVPYNDWYSQCVANPTPQPAPTPQPTPGPTPRPAATPHWSGQAGTGSASWTPPSHQWRPHRDWKATALACLVNTLLLTAACVVLYLVAVVAVWCRPSLASGPDDNGPLCEWASLPPLENCSCAGTAKRFGGSVCACCGAAASRLGLVGLKEAFETAEALVPSRVDGVVQAVRAVNHAIFSAFARCRGAGRASGTASQARSTGLLGGGR